MACSSMGCTPHYERPPPADATARASDERIAAVSESIVCNVRRKQCCKGTKLPTVPIASEGFTRQLAGLLHPGGELSFVELVVLVDVEVAHFLVLGLAGGRGRSDVPRKKATLTYLVKQ
jgi:hypothetical protein